MVQGRVASQLRVFNPPRTVHNHPGKVVCSVSSSLLLDSSEVPSFPACGLGISQPVLVLDGNPFLSHAQDPSDAITAQLAPPGLMAARTFEGLVDQLLDADPNAAGFMRKGVRAVFVSYPEEQWARAQEACPDLELHEYRALRFYSENYFKEINGCLRDGFSWPVIGSNTMQVQRLKAFYAPPSAPSPLSPPLSLFPLFLQPSLTPSGCC